jgi:hypothetical protein
VPQRQRRLAVAAIDFARKETAADLQVAMLRLFGLVAGATQRAGRWLDRN